MKHLVIMRKIYQYPKVTKITCHNVLQLLLYCCSIFMICMPELYLLSGNINTYTTSSFGVYIVARKIYRVQKFNGYNILYYHRWNSHILLKKLLNGIRASKKKSIVGKCFLRCLVANAIWSLSHLKTRAYFPYPYDVVE